MGERTIRVRVPGTSANCGPGFDSLGLACDIYNDLELTLTAEPGLEIRMSGEGAENIPCDERNICWQSVQLLLDKAGVTEFSPLPQRSTKVFAAWPAWCSARNLTRVATPC